MHLLNNNLNIFINQFLKDLNTFKGLHNDLMIC